MAQNLTHTNENSSKEPSNEPLTHGSCLCKLITFTLTGLPLTTVLCHCLNCKKTSGSAFQANNIYTSSQLSLLTGTHSLKKYEDHASDSGDVVQRSFCGVCGSRLFNQNPRFESVVAVMVGTLGVSCEEARGWKPEREYFCKRRATWLDGVGAGREAQLWGME